MCTAMMLHSPGGAVLFGRTMDFSYPLAPELYAVPRGYGWNNFTNTHHIRNQYGYLGIGQDLSRVQFADGVNEAGFGVAALYFPGFAQYDDAAPYDPKTPSITSTELVSLLLGLCADVDQAARMLRTIRIVGEKDPITDSVAPLHWILADRGGACVVAEKTAQGLQLMDNPVGVLTNSPGFLWHMTNLRNYGDLSPEQQQEQAWGGVQLAPFGQGAGGLGLPGDYTPPSRFVRTVFQKAHAKVPADRDGALNAWLHIMEGVSIPKGVVMSSSGSCDYTQYTAVMDLAQQEYFIRTYDNNRVFRARLPRGGAGGGIVSLGKLEQPMEYGSLSTGGGDGVDGRTQAGAAE